MVFRSDNTLAAQALTSLATPRSCIRQNADGRSSSHMLTHVLANVATPDAPRLDYSLFRGIMRAP